MLAAAEKAVQDKALSAILEYNLTVGAVKQQLQSISKSMAAAIFDKTDCVAFNRFGIAGHGMQFQPQWGIRWNGLNSEPDSKPVPVALYAAWTPLLPGRCS